MRWDTAPLQYVTQIDPSKSEVFGVPDDTLVSFLPMDAVGFGTVFEPPEDRPLGEIRSGYTYLADGDVAFAKISPSFQNGKSGRAEDLTSGIAMATTELTVLRPQPNVDGRFLQYVLRSDDFLRRGAETMHGVAGQQRVSSGFVAGYALALPPLEVQRRIADFLDTETARIDTLLATNHHATTLVSERVDSVIADAIGTELMESRAGIPIGVRGTQCRPLYSLATVQSGLTKNASNEDAESPAWPYLRVANVQDGHLDLAEVKTVQVSRTVAFHHLLRPGDVLMTEGGDPDKLGRGSVFQGEIDRCLHQNHVFAVRPNQAVILPEYLALATRSPYARAYFEKTSSKTTGIASTSARKIGEWRVPCPPPDVQRAALEIVRRESSTASGVLDSLGRQRDLLAERRQALITAVVTGELEV